MEPAHSLQSVSLQLQAQLAGGNRYGLSTEYSISPPESYIQNTFASFRIVQVGPGVKIVVKKFRQQSAMSPLSADGTVGRVHSTTPVPTEHRIEQALALLESELNPNPTTGSSPGSNSASVAAPVATSASFPDSNSAPESNLESGTASGTATVTTVRVEKLLSELHDRLADTFRSALAAALSGPSRAEETRTSPPAEPKPQRTETNNTKTQPHDISAVVPPKTWAEIRQSFLADSESPELAAPVAQPSVRTTGIPAAAAAASRSAARLPGSSAQIEAPIEIPEFGDPMTMTTDELRETLFSREKLLCKVIGQLRRHSQHPTVTLTTEQLRTLASDLPAELAGRVDQTLQQLDEQLRLGELELSLERARVGRQAAQNEITRHQLERGARQLGWTLNPDGTLTTNGTVTTRTSQPRRWLGKLGFGD